MQTLTIIFILIGMLMIGLAIPLLRRKVPPNNWYGFRIKQTLDNPDVWYPANVYAGKLLLIVGVVTKGLVGAFIILVIQFAIIFAIKFI